jgi:LysM repeat protein
MINKTLIKKSAQALLYIYIFAFSVACAPMEGHSRNEESLAVRELRIEIEDLRQKFDILSAESRIQESKINEQLGSFQSVRGEWQTLQHTDQEHTQSKLLSFIQKLGQLEQMQDKIVKDLKNLQSHSNDVASNLLLNQKKISAVKKDAKERESVIEKKFITLKGNVNSLIGLLEKRSSANMRTYVVKKGDSLERIARAHNTSIEAIKKRNRLDKDLIVIGQELELP